MADSDLEQGGLDRFMPKRDTPKMYAASSSKRVALFAFFAIAGVFMLVTFSILGSEQIVRGSRPPQEVMLPSETPSAIIPPMTIQPPEPMQEEEPSPIPQREVPTVTQEPPAPILVPNTPVRRVTATTRRSMPYISEARRAAQNLRMQAATSSTAVGGGSQNGTNPAATGVEAAMDALDRSYAPGGANAPTSSPAMNMDTGMSSSSNLSDPALSAMADPNGWARKDAFSNQPPTSEYSDHTLTIQRSVFEVKAGTVIPCVLISGLNSDLPGNAIAQVSENVWDTATGRYLLIPRGTRLIGTYDNQISYGQNRALVIWSRLIFPDGNSILLDNLRGADQSGYTGFRGSVNKHWGSLITSALLVSLIGAGVELAEPNRNNNNNNNNNNRNVGNILSERVASSIAEALTQIIKQEVQRQPTIKVKPGYRFMIMVQRDIILPKVWKQ